MAKKKFASLSITKKTKKELDSVKHPGQSYNGLVHELVELWKKEYGTGKLKRIGSLFGRK